MAQHVDDELLFGTRSDPIYLGVEELINTQFDIKGCGGLNNPTA